MSREPALRPEYAIGVAGVRLLFMILDSAVHAPKGRFLSSGTSGARLGGKREIANL